ncbi:MAG: phosphate signaling complex protein PhoU [Steroidobacterales bacterium]
MNTPHTVKAFDQDLGALAESIRAMGELAGTQFSAAVRSLLHSDLSLANRAIHDDDRLDALRREISAAAAVVIARRQPVAMDLEEVLAFMRTAADLERIGDLAKNIAKRSTAVISTHFPPDIVARLEQLAGLVSKQLEAALRAFVTRDAELALIARRQDEMIDELHTTMFQDLVARLGLDPARAVEFVHLLFCAKNIERIGDHATHVAEASYLIATGHRPEQERRRFDDSSTVTVGGPTPEA